MGQFARPAAAKVSHQVAQYFFDLRSGDTFSKDNFGIELPDAEAAHDMALGAARDAVMEGTIDQRFAVEVRIGTGRILEVGAVFHSRIFRRH